MSTRERLEREAADLEHAAQLAADIRTILVEHAALLAACMAMIEEGPLCAGPWADMRAAVALCREAPHA